NGYFYVFRRIVDINGLRSPVVQVSGLDKQVALVLGIPANQVEVSTRGVHLPISHAVDRRIDGADVAPTVGQQILIGDKFERKDGFRVAFRPDGQIGRASCRERV